MSHLSDINSAYQKLNAKADKLYEFVILYHNYIYAHHTYENENFSMLEIHTLTYIEDSPGITATEFPRSSKNWWTPDMWRSATRKITKSQYACM